MDHTKLNTTSYLYPTVQNSGSSNDGSTFAIKDTNTQENQITIANKPLA